MEQYVKLLYCFTGPRFKVEGKFASYIVIFHNLENMRIVAESRRGLFSMVTLAPRVYIITSGCRLLPSSVDCVDGEEP